jgi:hypothetical protein
VSARDTGPGYPVGSLRFSRPEGSGKLLHAVVRLGFQADNRDRLVRKVLHLHATRPPRRRGAQRRRAARARVVHLHLGGQHAVGSVDARHRRATRGDRGHRRA